MHVRAETIEPILMDAQVRHNKHINAIFFTSLSTNPHTLGHELIFFFNYTQNFNTCTKRIQPSLKKKS